jgi:hypothetical protein
MEKESDGQHRSSGRAYNDGQKSQFKAEVGQESGAETAKNMPGLPCDYNISTTSGAAGGLNKPGEKKGGADDQK